MFNYIRKRLFPKSLSREVLEVFAASPAIKKLGRNNEEDYDFLMIETICRDFKGEIFQRGIFIAATDLDCLFEEIKEGQGLSAARCTVRTKFEARRKCWFGMQRFDMGEALGSGIDQYDHIALAIAQTFAYKAMLKRSSLTYGVKDDPEMPRNTSPRSYREQAQIASYQGRAFRAAVQQSGKTEAQISEALSAAFGFPVTSDSIIALPRKQFDEAIKLITQDSDLSGEWGEALKYAKQKRAPQQVVSILDRKAKDEIAL